MHSLEDNKSSAAKRKAAIRGHVRGNGTKSQTCVTVDVFWCWQLEERIDRLSAELAKRKPTMLLHAERIRRLQTVLTQHCVYNMTRNSPHTKWLRRLDRCSSAWTTVLKMAWTLARELIEKTFHQLWACLFLWVELLDFCYAQLVRGKKAFYSC